MPVPDRNPHALFLDTTVLETANQRAAAVLLASNKIVNNLTQTSLKFLSYSRQ